MSTDELKRTAFDKVQRDLGASWNDWEGWAWAADFGDAVAEHNATRTACNMWDEAALRKWDMVGPDALALADVLFTNNMAELEVGQVRYGAICDEQGKMIMDGTIFHIAEGRCLSITSYDSDLDWFRKVASDRGLDVKVEDRTAEMPHLQVQGPKAREVLGPITEGVDLGALRYFRFTPEPVRVGGVSCWVSRTGYSGELGFELYCSVADAETLWNAVLAAGEPHGIKPIGLSAIETLRIESGLLFPDIEYFQHETDPYEVRLDKVVKLDKPGGFVGRDALAEIAAAGTPRLLTTLRIDGDEVPEYGATVTRDGREVGTLRSACQSPTFGMQTIGMAAIDRALVQDGERVDVALGDGVVGASVGRVPAVRHRQATAAVLATGGTGAGRLQGQAPTAATSGTSASSISSVSSRSAILSALPDVLIASSYIVTSLGQETTNRSTSGSATASRIRFSDGRSMPGVSGIQMRPPPAPQQKLLSRLRGISTSVQPSSSMIARGLSYSPLIRPRWQGSW